MDDSEHWRRLEAMYHAAPINKLIPFRLTVRDGEADIRLQVTPDLFHAAHALHGSMYFKALDDAAFFAANSRVPDVFVLTSQFNVHLLRPVADVEIRAAGRLVHGEGRSLLAESTLYDADGHILAHGRGTFARSKIALDTALGYAD